MTTPRELIAAATDAVEREDFEAAERHYVAAWKLTQAARTELEAARREADRSQLRETVIQSVFLVLLVGFAVSL